MIDYDTQGLLALGFLCTKIDARNTAGEIGIEWSLKQY
jgi:hypothetical protein